MMNALTSMMTALTTMGIVMEGVASVTALILGGWVALTTAKHFCIAPISFSIMLALVANLLIPLSTICEVISILLNVVLDMLLVAPVTQQALDAPRLVLTDEECLEVLVDAPMTILTVHALVSPAVNAEPLNFSDTITSVNASDEATTAVTSEDAPDINVQSTPPAKECKGLLQSLMEYNMYYKQFWYLPEPDIDGDLQLDLKSTVIEIESPVHTIIKPAFEPSRIAVFDPSGTLSVVYRKIRQIPVSQLGAWSIVPADLDNMEDNPTPTLDAAHSITNNPLLLPQEMTWGEDDGFLDESLDFGDGIAASSTVDANALMEQERTALSPPPRLEEALANIDQDDSFETEFNVSSIIAPAESEFAPPEVSFNFINAAVGVELPDYTVVKPAHRSKRTAAVHDSLSSLSPPPIFASLDNLLADDSFAFEIQSLSPPPIFSSSFSNVDDDEDESSALKDFGCETFLSWASRSSDEEDTSSDESAVSSLSPPPKFEDLMGEDDEDEDDGEYSMFLSTFVSSA
ncbi:hypothetical protein FRB93_007800 [Tulasnella sp. JGI-2019a]|nr:hypothetical protein FRB93_007800 [Tulasnella sp. JGI-2019a]